MVLGAGRLLAQGNVRDLKQAHERAVEVRVKTDPVRFARGLTEQGCGVEPQDDLLLVHLPPGRSRELLWRLAAASGEQIRYLRPRRSTLEEVFLKAVEDGG